MRKCHQFVGSLHKLLAAPKAGDAHIHTQYGIIYLNSMAMGITESVIEDIKSRIDLAELISSYGIQVKHAGATAKACCPFHHEKTPSFNINSSKGFYHCFGCGESGDAIKFVQKQEGLTFVEAVKKLAEQCGVKIEEAEDPNAGLRKRLYSLMAELAAFYRRCLLQAKEGETARKYLESRALAGAVAEDWGIGYAPNGVANILRWAEKYKYTPEELEAAGVVKAPNRPGDSGYHRFGGRLMFPVRDKQGRVVAFSGRQLVEKKNSGKYVNSPETAIFKKSNVLFGFDRAGRAIGKDPHCEVIVCEGQIDCIRLHASGFANAVAGQGTAFTDEHVRMLKRVASQAVLVYDDDAAGHKPGDLLEEHVAVGIADGHRRMLVQFGRLRMVGDQILPGMILVVLDFPVQGPVIGVDIEEIHIDGHLHALLLEVLGLKHLFHDDDFSVRDGRDDRVAPHLRPVGHPVEPHDEIHEGRQEEGQRDGKPAPGNEIQGEEHQHQGDGPGHGDGSVTIFIYYHTNRYIKLNNPRYRAPIGMASRLLSKRSSMPPCPGMMLPESLTS